MALEVVRHPSVALDVRGVPIHVLEEADRIVAALRQRPFEGGLGYTVRSVEGRIDPGVRVVHFRRNEYRILYWVKDPWLMIYGIGHREAPDFYATRMPRLKAGPLAR